MKRDYYREGHSKLERSDIELEGSEIEKAECESGLSRAKDDNHAGAGMAISDHLREK